MTPCPSPWLYAVGGFVTALVALPLAAVAFLRWWVGPPEVTRRRDDRLP